MAVNEFEEQISSHTQPGFTYNYFKIKSVFHNSNCNVLTARVVIIIN